MLYRHVQPLFLSPFSENRLTGPKLRVRTLDSDAPDHLMQFIFWGALLEQVVPVTRAPAPDPGVVIISAPTVPVQPPSQARLFIEMSADGEGWVVQSELPPRERPYLVTVAHMLPFVRVRLEPGAAPARGYAAVLANTPFVLDGRSPIVGQDPQVGTKDPVVVKV